MNGRLDDGNNRKLYNAYFDPGHTKFSIWRINRAIEIDKKLNFCTNCGLIWQATEPKWIQEFIIRNCKKEYVEKIFNPLPSIKEYGIVDHSTINLNPEYKGEVDCINCGSSSVIIGKFYIYLQFRRQFNLKRYSVLFDPGHIKGIHFLFKRGVPIRKKVKGCIECGYLFSNIDPGLMKEYVKTKCKIDFFNRVYG